MAGATEGKADVLGLWVRLWDISIALAGLIAAFLLVRLDAIPQLKTMAVDKAWFETRPLLLDVHRRGYSFETVRDHLRALGAEGRDFYAHTFVPFHDLALSVFLLVFLILLVLYATQSDKPHALGLPPGARKLLVVPPILQFAFDVGENLTLRQLIGAFPRIDPDLVWWASAFTQLKWGAVLFNALIVVGLGGFTLYQWIVRPSQRP